MRENKSNLLTLLKNLNILSFLVKVHKFTEYKCVWYHFRVPVNNTIVRNVYFSQNIKKIRKLVGPVMPLIGKQLRLSEVVTHQLTGRSKSDPLNWYYATQVVS